MAILSKLKKSSEKYLQYTKSLGLMLFGEGMIKGGQFVVNIVIARNLTVDSYGIFNDVFSFTQFFAIFSDFGTSTFLVREISSGKESQKSAFEKYIPLKIVLMLFSFLLTMVTLYIFKPNDYLSLGIILSIYNILQLGYLTYLYAIHRGKKDFLTETLSKSIGFLLLFVGLAIFLKNPNLYRASWVYALSTIIPAILLTAYTVYKFRVQIRNILTKIQIFKPLKEVTPQGISIVMYVLVTIVPIQYIAFVGSNYDVGIFSAAYRLILPLMLLMIVVNRSLLPFLSSTKSVFKKLFNLQTLTLTTVFLLLYIVVGFLLTPYVVDLLLGDRYSEAVPILMILLLLPVVQFFFTFIGYNFIALRRDTIYTRFSVISFILMLILMISFEVFADLDLLIYVALAMVIAPTVLLLFMIPLFKKYSEADLKGR